MEVSALKTEGLFKKFVAITTNTRFTYKTSYKGLYTCVCYPLGGNCAVYIKSDL